MDSNYDALNNQFRGLGITRQQLTPSKYQAPPQTYGSNPTRHAPAYRPPSQPPSSLTLDIQDLGLWKDVQLCKYNGIKRRGQDVAGFDQSTGEPTLWFKDERQIGRKILNYQSCIPLLKEGFAKKYAEYEGMFLRESPLGDENFQAFLFVKWLDSKNENLHIFVTMCLHEDRENLYKAWLIDVCGFFQTRESSKQRMLTQPGNNLQEYMSFEQKTTGKRYNIKKVKEELDLFKGTDLPGLFYNFLRNYSTNSKKIHFTIREKCVFTLKIKNANGNGVIVFSPDVEKVCPRWEIFPKTVMKKGFRNRYMYFKRSFNELKDGCELDKNFQAFVLLQLEIARVRVKENPQLNTDEIVDGIRKAFYMDGEKYYKHLTQMFMGKKRREYYNLLKRRVEIEARIEQMLHQFAV